MDLWIVGGSGAALEVWAVARAQAATSPQAWTLRGFITPEGTTEFDPEGLEVRAEAAFLAAPPQAPTQVCLAVGAPRLRQRIAQRYAAAGLGFATLIHPTAVVGPQVDLGEGSVLMAQAVLETHVTVGPHALLNVGTSIAHNGELGTCCSLGPGVRLAGWVTLGDRCDLGVGACVRPRTTLPPDTVVGAGAAVVQTLTEPGLTLVGVPARLLPRSS